MKVKEIDRTVNVAWSPATQYPILLAAGTAAQQLDSSFSTSAALELYSLNLGEPGLDMELQVSAPSDYRFHKIAWGQFGSGHDKGGGIIVGGCDGGRIQIYSASKLLSGEDGLIVSQEKHTGPVQALDFNPYQYNLLATGASESEIFIWDLNNLNTPMTPGAKAQPPENVVCMAWNRQVQHILASTFAQRCVVWDLRKNEPIIKLSDGTTRIRWKVIAWHPEVATQMCLASEEDQNPVIQLWDLRFATSPLKVLENHQRGVLSIAWCTQDPELLVSCGKDNRILCWNPESATPGGEVVSDVATTNQWNFDVSWCPRNPALIAASSFDGHVSVYSLLGGQQQMQTSNKIADSFPGMEVYAHAPVPQQQAVPVDLRKPPKWLRRPVGASFGFGGQLVTFVNPGPALSRTVVVAQVVTEPELIEASRLLEEALQSGQYVEFCQSKMAMCTNPHDKYVWSFLKASFSMSPQAEILNLLGFKREELHVKLKRLLGKPANARADPVDSVAEGVAALGREAPDGDASASFDAIAAENHACAKSPRALRIPVGDDIDGLISQALLLGNVESAVDLCLNDGRMADAIMLAMTGGTELLAKTQRLYFQQSTSQVSALIAAVVNEDWSCIVDECEMESWKEALAAALTHTNSDEFSSLCERLGHRLENEGHENYKLNAQLCYICAGSVTRLVDCWSESLNPDTPSKMQDLVERVMILSKAAEFQGRNARACGSLAPFLSQYASMLAAQGSLTAAVSYLGNTQQENVKELRERLYTALGHRSAYEDVRPPVQQSQQPLTNRRSATNYYSNPQQQMPYAPFHEQPLMNNPTPHAAQLFGRPNPTPSPASAAQQPASASVGGKSRPYVLDPSVQSGPYGSSSAPSVYQALSGAHLSQGLPVGAVPAEAAVPRALSPDMSAPGWNDPPAVKGGTRSQPKPDYQPQAPITHPLFGTMASSPDCAPPPLTCSMPSSVPVAMPSAMPVAMPSATPAGGMASVGANAYKYMNLTHPFNTIQQQQLPQQNFQQQPHSSAVKAELPKPKLPVPEEHMYLQTVFNELRDRCVTAANNPQTKRKLDDVARKLEVLYDGLRESKLSPNTLTYLHQMVQMVQTGNYTGGLGVHTQLVSGPDFSQISSFMPGLKVLLQLALQLGVYLQ